VSRGKQQYNVSVETVNEITDFSRVHHIIISPVLGFLCDVICFVFPYVVLNRKFVLNDIDYFKVIFNWHFRKNM